MEHTPALLGHDLRGIREAFAKVLGGYHRLKEGSTAWALAESHMEILENNDEETDLWYL